jgi:hypothetical protein
MSHGGEIDWIGQYDAAEREPEARQAGSRRWLLGAAAGSFALAASGLVLPIWLVEEAEAAEYPVRRIQRRKDQRRKKRRNELQHRREVQRRQDDEKPRGRDFLELRNVAIYVHNLRPVPVQVQGWQKEQLDNHPFPRFGFRQRPGWTWSTIPARTGVPYSTKDFVGTSTFVVVQIGTDRVVRGTNSPAPFAPSAEIVTGEWNEDGQGSCEDCLPRGDTLKEGHLAVGGTIEAQGIRISRVYDTEDHIVFSVDLT